jgi:phosphoribosylanthranilate isomerase
MIPFLSLGRTAVKICGITTAEQASAILSAGADAIGLNFWPKSKRYISPTAASWAADITGATRVAVLVNPDDELVTQIVSSGLVDALQLHGDETPERCAELARHGLPIIKAIQVKDESTLATITHYPAAAVLLDSYNPGTYGGEGKSFPWELATRAITTSPQLPVILAGGLTPENVASAVHGTRPAAVDVASGVESAPGVKDLEKVRLFIQQVRQAQS